jgi:hypothetical protein
MSLLSCAAVRGRLPAYLDKELPVEEQIEIALHLEGCPPCTYEARDLQEIGDSLRLAATSAGPSQDSIIGLRATVLSRLKVEEEQSLIAQLRRMFDDMHLVWAGLSATAATLTCAVLLFTIGYLAPPERADSLAGVLSALASPGSNRNPVSIDLSISPPRFAPDLAMPAVFDSSQLGEEDLVFALAAVVTQEGRVENAELLLVNRRDRQTVTRLMNAVIEARFEPASYRGAPVAVNFVWLLTHTTVRAKTHS